MSRSSANAIARHHAEWRYKLIDVSGPFLTVKTLTDAWPQGLDPHEPGIAQDLREVRAEWEETCTDPAKHRLFVRFILEDVLGHDEDCLHEGPAIPAALRVTVPEHGETLAPDLLIAPAPDAPAHQRLPVVIVPASQGLERPMKDRRWKDSPTSRTTRLLRESGTRCGLLTNGHLWTLVDAPREGTAGYATWHAELWSEESLTLRAFRSLLGPDRLFGRPDEETLQGLLADSADDQREVTDTLGRQVREALEIFVHALDREDRGRGGELLAGHSPRVVYEASVTVMMRLVFLFCAEDRGLLPLDDERYQAHLAASTLLERLRERADRHGEAVLERTHGAWHRLLALFRAVHAGVRHEDLHLPAYGGHLFSPDRFPFLEGRAEGTEWRTTPAQPLPLDDGTILRVLERLQMLSDTATKERYKLSFRALDIEQIGHVYEGLLDHTCKRAPGTVLSLAGSKGKTAEIPLEELDAVLDESSKETALKAIGKRLGRSGKAALSLEKKLYPDLDEDARRGLLVACGESQDLYERVQPFGSLLREGPDGRPYVIPEGSLHVAEGTDRRASGTHYTPRDLTESIVQHALDPIVYVGPAEGRPREEWQLRSPGELLELRILDFACGSGAFLVQACRYLADRLLEAWEQRETEHPGQLLVTPEGELSAARPEDVLVPAPDQVEERLVLARRLVADRCLYGVDVNPLAVEMARLSLWLLTLQRDRPFTFLDHAIRCGDSLLGITSVEQVVHFHLDPERGRALHAHTGQIDSFAKAVEDARTLREELVTFTVKELRDAERKAALLADANERLTELREGADLLLGHALRHAKSPTSKAAEEELKQYALYIHANELPREERRKIALAALNEGRPAKAEQRRPFHWPLEFPEVFASGETRRAPGFDAIVGNPPFIGGQKITGGFGTDYRDHLVTHLAAGNRGSADLVAYFFLRAEALLRAGGTFGLLSTNTLAQGDTREVGLDQLEERGCTFYRAIKSKKWPGEASLEVAHVWARKGEWRAPSTLEDAPVSAITSFLVERGKISGKPYRLAANRDLAFQGSIVLGMGFVLTPEEAQALIARDERNRDVLYPYLNGKDLNSRPDQSPSRWVINFHDWPLDRASAPEGYEGPVAADYPECLRIVEEKVKPERDRLAGGNATAEDRARRWWQFACPTRKLYRKIAPLDRVLVTGLVNNHLVMVPVPAGQVFSHKLAVFPSQDAAFNACLQSSLHYHWAWAQSSTMRVDINYSPTDCVDTFSFPKGVDPSNPLTACWHNLTAARQALCTESGLGLTKIYNAVHDQTTSSPLRDLIVALDDEAFAAFGWDDMPRSYGFVDLPQGRRFSFALSQRAEVLQRLLELNHQRYAEEVEQGLHEPKTAKRSTRKKAARKTAARRKAKPINPTGDLFGD